MEKRIIQLIVLVIAIFLIWDTWHPFWRYDLNEAANSSNQEKVIFEISKGSSAKTIAGNLEDMELIVHKKSFIRTVEEEDLDQSLRYGKFVLSPSMTLRQIISILTTEGTGEMAVTIPEGWTINDIDQKLSDLGLLHPGEFRICTFNCDFEYDFLGNDRSLEGFLFPDTYFVDSSSFTAETFINQMLSNFDNKLTDEMEADIEEADRTIRETIIVASMIEKEVRTKDDMSTVSGIIWKRLDNGWALGIDATFLYTKDTNEISAEDLSTDSPYNTRINTGLPPTAISNPGLNSIMAAIYPEDSDYWFYLTAPDTGEVIFAETNEGHEANKATYLE